MGQNTPVFRQFYFNPYLFNPAFAGIDGYTKVSVLYRKQWVGFNNAPTGAGLSIEHPTLNKVSFGFNVLSSEIVALRTTSIHATFAYRIPLAANHYLFFGLSGIVGSNRLTISDADYSNDPTILAAANNNFYANANFGVAYEWSGLRVGFALPKLVNQKYFGALAEENSTFAQFRNQLYSVSYKIRASDFVIQPYGLYRLNQDFQDWWEAATVLYYKEKVWLGGSYNSTQGAGFFLGVEIKEKFRFGYSYELPPVDKQFIATSSHELQLQFKLGKKRIFKWAAKYAKQPEEDHEVVTTQVDTETSPDTLIVQQQPKEILEVVKKQLDTIKVKSDSVEVKEEIAFLKQKPLVQPTLEKGLYVIADSFKGIESARARQQYLLKQGIKEVEISLNPKNGLYCVYVFSSFDLEECKKAVKGFQSKEATREVWILRIE